MAKPDKVSGYKKRQMHILSGNPGPRQMFVPFGSPNAVKPASVAEIKAYEESLRKEEAEEMQGGIAK
jgi:hypothetical protein